MKTKEKVANISSKNLSKRVGFAIGTGRCGTKFLYRVFDLEPQVASVHERNPLNETFHRYCKWYDLPLDHEGFLQTKECEIKQDLEKYSFSFEASAFLSLSVQELYDRFEAKFILLVRSPEQVVNSYLCKGWYDKIAMRANPNLAPSYQDCRAFHHFLGRIMPSGEKFQQWNQMSRVGKLAWYWNALNAKVLEQFKDIPETHWRVEKLEDLSYSRYLEIAQFLGFQPTVTQEEYGKLARRRPNAMNQLAQQRPKAYANTSTISAWTTSEIAEFETQVAPIAERFGYEYRVNYLLIPPQKKLLAKQSSTESLEIKQLGTLKLNRLKSHLNNLALTTINQFSDASKLTTAEASKVIYISQGNIPSKWAHTFQAMKMAEALAKQTESLTLLTGGSLLPSQMSTVNLAEWYGVPCSFNIVSLPVHWHLNEPLFSGYRYPRFDRAAALYSKLKAPNLVFTRSPYAGHLCARLKLNTIIETHIGIEHSEFKLLKAICHTPSLLGIVTVTDYLKHKYIKAGLPENKILVWPDAVELSMFANLPPTQVLRDELGLPLEKKIATYCGHLYDSKGVPYFIAAAKYLPEVLFCLVGGWSQDIERCREQAKGLKNIHFAGFVPNQQVPKYLAASDFLMLPNSMKHELAYSTSPLKLFEYMAARRPVIASNIPALQGFLKHKENAFLIEPDSPTAIASALDTLTQDQNLSAQMVQQAWQEVQQFTWSHRAKDILTHFQIINY